MQLHIRLKTLDQVVSLQIILTTQRVFPEEFLTLPYLNPLFPYVLGMGLNLAMVVVMVDGCCRVSWVFNTDFGQVIL